MTRVHSRLYSLADIAREAPAWQFNVPIYQRLYVWGDDQVQTLLSDLINAFERKAPLFFLGGTLLVEQGGATHLRRFDLIDGQQRFTTLWLLCCAWGGALKPFVTVPTSQTDTPPTPRLGFSIRPAVDRLLHALAQEVTSEHLPDALGAERLGRAMQSMRSLVAERGSTVDWAGLTRFVFEQVKFVVTLVPLDTDLNKLFEVINNRGVQLQHHEILKARMLELIDDSERSAYAVMWDACADMENYVERTLSAVSGLPAYRVCEELHLKKELADAQAVVHLLMSHQGMPSAGGARTLTEILCSPSDAADKVGSGAVNDARVTRVRSIIGFPLLLQHALRIWRFEQGLSDLPRVLDRELLALFEQHFDDETASRCFNAAAKARSFLHLLWRLRVLFDAYVIKWVDHGQDEVHLISSTGVSVSKGHRYVSRSTDSDAHRGLALLQSMLYHSQEITTHYWLTPFLLHVHRHEGEGAEAHFQYLQHLDNHLLGSVALDSLAVRTRSFMEQPWQVRTLVHATELLKDNGVRFAHYWFYKLEFVLWFQKLRNGEAWKTFRLTAKNSVEHISPQTPSQHDDNRVSVAMLNRFGNLALVSRSINSEYGNLPFNEKKQRFLNKNKLGLDSLKMALIYEASIWNDEVARAHQSDMIDCLDRYVLACNAQRPHGKP